MEGPKKKTKYIEKTVYETQKIQKYFAPKEKPLEPQKKIEEKQKNKEATVINVKVANLRKYGYHSLEEWLQDENHVYIGRHNHYVPGAVASKWANPFKVDQFGRDECISKFKEYFLKNNKLMSQIGQLRGKVLGCWCAPQNCHGYVLAEMANSLKQTHDLH